MILVRHEMRRAWKALMIWTLAIGAFMAITLFMYPEMKGQMDSVSALFSSMGAFSSAFGLDTLDFGTLRGYYGIECGNTLGIGGALFASLLGIGMLAGEESSRTAEFLLTHPLNRHEVVTSKLAAMLMQLLILNVLVLIMAFLSIMAIGEAVPWKEVILLHTAYFLLQTELACICLGLSAFLRKGGVGVGLGIGLAMIMYFLNILANLSGRAEFLKYLTPFGYADGSEIFSRGAMDTGRLLTGLAMTCMGTVLAYWKYCRKDIL